MQPGDWVGLPPAEGREGCRTLGSLPFSGPHSFLSIGCAMARWKSWPSSTEPESGRGTRIGTSAAGTGAPKHCDPATAPGSGSGGRVRRDRLQPQPALRASSPFPSRLQSETCSRISVQTALYMGSRATESLGTEVGRIGLQRSALVLAGRSAASRLGDDRR